MKKPLMWCLVVVMLVLAGYFSMSYVQEPSAPEKSTAASTKFAPEQLGAAKKMGVPVTITNSIGMKLVLIPAGEFMMGSPDSDGALAHTQQKVRIPKPFYLGECEVTQGQYAALMNARPWTRGPLVMEGNDYAATYVNWHNAAECCKRLSEKEGRLYRLPTEAEWEYACRGGTTSPFHFGDDASRLSAYAWFKENCSDLHRGYSQKVGQKKSNPYGLYDMHGNVAEWCSDWYEAKSPVYGPDGPLKGPFKVSRGGSWTSPATNCRSVSRGACETRFRIFSLGFRVAASPSANPASNAPSDGQ